MLQSIRDKTQGWIAGVIVSLLILSFALWGIHSYIEGSSGNDVIAKVDGVEIFKNQVSSTYERMRQQLGTQLGGTQLPVQLESSLKERALQSIIESEALKQASIARDYRVSNFQVDSFLQSLPEFQENGKFSFTLFRQVVANNGYRPGDFLELIRTSLLIDQPRLGILLTSFALPHEVVNIASLINQERDIQYAELPLELISKQIKSISEDQIKAYYDQHENEFKTLEQVSIEYVELSFEDLRKAIQPTEDALKKFYNDTSSSYTASSQKAGTNQAGAVQSFEQVKDKVTAAYIQQKAEEKFAELREKLANISYEHPESLVPVAKELGLKVQSSTAFTKGQTTKESKEITANPKIQDAAFSEDVLVHQNNSDVIQVNGDKALVLRVKTHAPAALIPLDKIRQSIVAKLTAIELAKKAQEVAKEIEQQLSSGKMTVEQATSQYHLSWKDVGFINRQAKNVDPSILATAFSIPRSLKANSTGFAIAKTATSYAIVGLKAVKEGAMPSNAKDNKALTEQVQHAEALVEYELYKQSIIKDAKIKINT
jgi:peptidyl-prolyl cis-trans isomerase D